jgi:hypothetical protein
LHEIAARVTALDDGQVSAAVAGAAEAPPLVRNAASEYIRNLLGSTPESEDVVVPPLSSQLSPPRPSRAHPSPSFTRRENWERINVTADVELHVRRPLSREMNRRIERLLAVARQILTDQPPGGGEEK